MILTSETVELNGFELFLFILVMFIPLIILIIWLIIWMIKDKIKDSFQEGFNTAILYKHKFDIVKDDIRKFSKEIKKCLETEYHHIESIQTIEKLLNYLDNVY